MACTAPASREQEQCGHASPMKTPVPSFARDRELRYVLMQELARRIPNDLGDDVQIFVISGSPGMVATPS